ncbi:hypothetical protein LCGC14_3125340, partial [marine sediment metagenome]
MPQLSSKINRAVINGQDAFWEAVKKEFPEIKTGDFAPDAEYDFGVSCNLAVIRWVGANSNVKK